MQPEMQVESCPDSSRGSKMQVPALPHPRWTGATKIAFRFGFVYFGLYNLHTALYLLAFPPFTRLSALYEAMWGKTVPWVSKHVLHLTHSFGTDYLNTGSGSKDTTFAFVQVFCFLVLAAAAALVWSLVDRKRREYRWLYGWFVVYLRLSLAAALIPYGAVKLFPMQFPPPTPFQLLQPSGLLAPRQLLWLSMGASASYTFFGGLMEVSAGLLLAVPQLATLGALLSTAVMVNVLMLNVGYDVAVKLFTINLILMGLVILLPDVARLIDFFVFNRSVPAAPRRPLFRRKSLNQAVVVLQIAFGIVLLSYDVYRAHEIATQKVLSKNTPLYGIWLVDDYQVDGRPIAALSSDAHRWQRMIVNSSDNAVVQVMTGAFSSLHLRADSHSDSLVLTQAGNPNWIAELAYDNSRPGSLVLTGKMGGLPVEIRLHREDLSKFPLSNPTIHWVNDGDK